MSVLLRQVVRGEPLQPPAGILPHAHHRPRSRQAVAAGGLQQRRRPNGAVGQERRIRVIAASRGGETGRGPLESLWEAVAQRRLPQGFPRLLRALRGEAHDCAVGVEPPRGVVPRERHRGLHRRGAAAAANNAARTALLLLLLLPVRRRRSGGHPAAVCVRTREVNGPVRGHPEGEHEQPHAAARGGLVARRLVAAPPRDAAAPPRRRVLIELPHDRVVALCPLGQCQDIRGGVRVMVWGVRWGVVPGDERRMEEHAADAVGG